MTSSPLVRCNRWTFTHRQSRTPVGKRLRVAHKGSRYQTGSGVRGAGISRGFVFAREGTMSYQGRIALCEQNPMRGASQEKGQNEFEN